MQCDVTLNLYLLNGDNQSQIGYLNPDKLNTADSEMGWLYYTSDHKNIVIEACSDGPF